MYSQKGAQAFTSSLINIMRQAGLVRKEQPYSEGKTKTRGWEAPRRPRGFQTNQRRRDQPRDFQIPTKNRFENIENEFFWSEFDKEGLITKFLIFTFHW